MSCQICHQITGHAIDCRYFHEDVAAEQRSLSERMEELERSHERNFAELKHLLMTQRMSAGADPMPGETPPGATTDYAHLMRLYRESRDYVRALERERDDLVEAGKRHVAEVDQLDAEVERMRPVYEAAKRMRASVPCDAPEMRERKFHATTCDLVEAVDRAIESEPKHVGPYRGAT